MRYQPRGPLGFVVFVLCGLAWLIYCLWSISPSVALIVVVSGGAFLLLVAIFSIIPREDDIIDESGDITTALWAIGDTQYLRGTAWEYRYPDSNNGVRRWLPGWNLKRLSEYTGRNLDVSAHSLAGGPERRMNVRE